jgi:hypothetical protein
MNSTRLSTLYSSGRLSAQPHRGFTSRRLPWSSRIIQTFIEHMYARNMALGEYYHLFIERALAPIQEIKEMALLRHLVTPQSL